MMLIVGIAGGTGSGKSTVANAIVSQLGAGHVALIPQDAYYRDYPELSLEERQQLNYDHPDAFENELLLAHLHALRRGQAIDLPIYDFSMHRRKQTCVCIESRPVIIVEGIHVLVDRELRDALDIKVYVDTDSDVRVLRRLVRDIHERGRSVDSVCNQYLTTVKPMHDAFVEPSKRHADLIIPEGGENAIAISLLTTRIQTYLPADSIRG